jgi:hypothetical protein
MQIENRAVNLTEQAAQSRFDQAEGVAAATQFFLFRLNPPRITFPMDITADEASVMQEHFGYWAGLAREGTAIAYGPVNDPKGTWGVAIVRVADDHAARNLVAGDPAIQSRLGFNYEILPMPQAIVAVAQEKCVQPQVERDEIIFL